MNEEDSTHIPTEAEIERFKQMIPMLESMLKEMREFSKKKQDAFVSATKVKIINRLLDDIRKIVHDDEFEKYLDSIDDESIPSNSDVVLILGQYDVALKRYSFKHYKRSPFYREQFWHTVEFFARLKEDEEEDERDYDEEEDEE